MLNDSLSDRSEGWRYVTQLLFCLTNILKVNSPPFTHAFLDTIHSLINSIIIQALQNRKDVETDICTYQSYFSEEIKHTT